MKDAREPLEGSRSEEAEGADSGAEHGDGLEGPGGLEERVRTLIAGLHPLLEEFADDPAS